jgi:parallel beta-helix repeat protein
MNGKTTLNRTIVLSLAFLFLASSFLIFAPVASASSSSCSVTILKENGSNNAIQSAINAAEAGTTGPVICITGPGTYPEQLQITSSDPSTNTGIQLIGVGSAQPLIQPTSVSSNGADVDTSLPIAAIIFVGGPSSSITGVVIQNLNVDGTTASSSFSNCATDYMGIIYQDASGTISGNTVNGIYLPAADAGCQDGQGIYVQTALGQTSTVTIASNQVTNYNKNGITCNDANTNCKISKNLASFYTTYEPYIAPNGIQIGFGAVGKVSLNTVENNICTVGAPSGTCGNNLETQTQGCGILTYQSASGTAVSSNTATDNDIGICLAEDAASANGNTVSGSNAAAILQYDGTGTYSANKNALSNNPIGFEILNDGGVSSSFTSVVKGGNTFGTDPIKVQVQTESATVVLYFIGHKFTITGTATVDIS